MIIATLSVDQSPFRVALAPALLPIISSLQRTGAGFIPRNSRTMDKLTKRGHQVGFGGKLLIDEGLGTEFIYLTLAPHHIGFNYQLVAGNHLASETDIIQAGKINQISLEPVFISQISQYPPHLSHAFQNQNAGHDRVSGEMALKERLVDADVFQPHGPISQFQLDNSIDQDKGVTMGQKFKNLFNINLIIVVHSCLDSPSCKMAPNW